MELTAMTTAELEGLLSNLRADLEEVEGERVFVLSQTGVHISAATVARYESECNSLRGRVEEVEEALRHRGVDEG